MLRRLFRELGRPRGRRPRHRHIDSVSDTALLVEAAHQERPRVGRFWNPRVEYAQMTWGYTGVTADGRVYSLRKNGTQVQVWRELLLQRYLIAVVGSMAEAKAVLRATA